MKKNTSQLPLAVLQASFSNNAAEKCSMLPLVFAFLFLLFTGIALSFPFIKERYTHTLAATDVRLYPGLGRALITAASAEPFSVLDGKFHMQTDETIVIGTVQPIQGWIIALNAADPASFVREDVKTLVFGKDMMIISNPEEGIQVEGTYAPFAGLTSETLRASLSDDSAGVTFVRAFVFRLATESLLPAMMAIFILMVTQTVFFALVISVLFMIPFRGDTTKEYGFWNTVKIISTLGVFPSLCIALIGYFFTAFTLSFGWILYTLAFVVRVIVLYMGRLKRKSKNS